MIIQDPKSPTPKSPCSLLSLLLMGLLSSSIHAEVRPCHGSAHRFDTDHVSSGAVVDRTLTHLRNETHRGAVPILARVVGTAPGGPGSAHPLIGLMGEQSAESGYKFSSRHFFGNSERACDLWPRFKEEQIVDTHSSFFSRNQVVHAVYGGVTGPWLRSIRG